VCGLMLFFWLCWAVCYSWV